MSLICPWCRREGKYGDLLEKELLDDRSQTHGICARHEAQLLAEFPSPSFPDVELLIVVHCGDHILFEYLQQRLAGLRGVKVILERREGDRRREVQTQANDRRLLRRRVRHGQVSSLGYTIVRFRRK